MKKNTFIVLGVVAGLAVIIGVSLSMKSNKTPAPVNTNIANIVVAPDVHTTIIMKDLSFSPSEFAAGASQTIKVRLVNQETSAHALVFDTLDFNSSPVDPGQSKTVTFTTPSAPGSYAWHCDQVDHKDKGMIGMMVVQ